VDCCSAAAIVLAVSYFIQATKPISQALNCYVCGLLPVTCVTVFVKCELFYVLSVFSLFNCFISGLAYCLQSVFNCLLVQWTTGLPYALMYLCALVFSRGALYIYNLWTTVSASLCIAVFSDFRLYFCCRTCYIATYWKTRRGPETRWVRVRDSTRGCSRGRVWSHFAGAVAGGVLLHPTRTRPVAIPTAGGC
jgi:hypothetical protein